MPDLSVVSEDSPCLPRSGAVVVDLADSESVEEGGEGGCSGLTVRAERSCWIFGRDGGGE